MNAENGRSPVTDIVEVTGYVESLPSEAARLVCVTPGVKSVQQAPYFLLGTVRAATSISMLGNVTIDPSTILLLSNAAVTIDGIIVHDGHALSSAHLNQPWDHVGAMITSLPAFGQQLPVREIAGEAVLLAGPGSHIYGHWLLDFLPRLYVLDKAGYDLSKLRYIVPEHVHFAPAMLEALSIGSDQLIPYRHDAERLQVDRLVAPGNLRSGSRFNPSMREAREFMLRHLDVAAKRGPPTVRKLFLARSGPSDRLLTNRDEVHQLAAENGYTLIDPARLEFGDQAALLFGADVIMGEYGSGLHNSLFAQSGTIVCALRGDTVDPGFIQSGLNEVCRHRGGYVFGEVDADSTRHSFSIRPDLLLMAMSCIDVMLENEAGPT